MHTPVATTVTSVRHDRATRVLSQVINKTALIDTYRPVIYQARTIALNDPVAQKTQWTCLTMEERICTHRLLQKKDKLFYRVRPAILTLTLLVMILGVALTVSGWMAFSQGEGFLYLGGVPLGLVMTLLPSFMLRVWDQPKGFDVASGLGEIGGKNFTLTTIHAIQVIGSRHKEDLIYYRDMHTQPNYEINLVFDDGSRILVINHGDRYTILQDAKRMALFLQCQLWEALP